MPEGRSSSTPAPPGAPVPARVTLPLLALITQQSLDEDYLHAAERRVRAAAAGDEPHPSRSGPHRVAAVVVTIFGILVTTAAVQTSRNEDVDAASRVTLVRRIGDERVRVSTLQDRVVRLRERNAQLERQLSQSRDSLEASVTRLRRLQARTGYVPVTGPGVRITLDDGPPEINGSAVLDRDLRLVVNGLWRLGAEAIEINGQRLTALSAIRSSGLTIRVNRVNLSPPYVVEAIGDTRTLQADFLDSPEGQFVLSLVDEVDIAFDMTNDNALELTAARLRDLRHAEPLGGGRPRPPEEAP